MYMMYTYTYTCMCTKYMYMYNYKDVVDLDCEGWLTYTHRIISQQVGREKGREGEGEREGGRGEGEGGRERRGGGRGKEEGYVRERMVVEKSKRKGGRER